MDNFTVKATINPVSLSPYSTLSSGEEEEELSSANGKTHRGDRDQCVIYGVMK